MAARPARSGIRRVFANRNYRLYFTGNAVSLIGTWMQRTGVGVLAWELTHSATFLGLVAVAEFLPSILLGPFAGAVADRVSRLGIIAAMQGLLCVQALMLGVLTVTGLMTPEALFLLTLLLGAATAVAQPARLSLVPSLVGREDIPSAVAVNSVGWNSARFVGPMVAAPLLLHLGPVSGAGWAFLCNTLTFGVFLIVLPMLRLTPRLQAARERRGLFAEIGEGFGYIGRHAGVGPLILLLLAGALLVRPYVELLPAFADVVFERGAEGFSMLIAVNGLGALAGGLWLAQRGNRQGLAAIVFGGAAVHAAMVALFSVIGDFHLALAALGTAGFAMLVMGVGAQSLIQMGTPSDMLGRVLSVYGLSFRAGPALGALAMGALADSVGLLWPVFGGACLCLLAVMLLARRLPGIRTALEPER